MTEPVDQDLLGAVSALAQGCMGGRVMLLRVAAVRDPAQFLAGLRELGQEHAYLGLALLDRVAELEGGGVRESGTANADSAT